MAWSLIARDLDADSTEIDDESWRINVLQGNEPGALGTFDIFINIINEHTLTWLATGCLGARVKETDVGFDLADRVRENETVEMLKNGLELAAKMIGVEFVRIRPEVDRVARLLEAGNEVILQFDAHACNGNESQPPTRIVKETIH